MLVVVFLLVLLKSKLEKMRIFFFGEIFFGEKINKLDEAELVTENDEAAAAGLANAPGRGLVSV